jgi:hypothetical protein
MKYSEEFHIATPPKKRIKLAQIQEKRLLERFGPSLYSEISEMADLIKSSERNPPHIRRS